jgi:hypothetical protein
MAGSRSNEPSRSDNQPKLVALNFEDLATETLVDRGEIWLLHWLKDLDSNIERAEEVS